VVRGREREHFDQKRKTVSLIQSFSLTAIERETLRIVDAGESVPDTRAHAKAMVVLYRFGFTDQFNHLTERGREALELCS
jgi:hypothetical protein